MRGAKAGGRLKVAIAQINTTVGAIDKNIAKIKSYLKQAAAKEANLVVFPELTLTGYPPEDLLYNPLFIQKNIQALHQLVPTSKHISFVVGFANRAADGRLYNAAAFLSAGKIQTIYHKCELPNYGVFDERRYFEPGASGGVISFRPKTKIGLSICEDMWEQNSFLYSPKFTKKLSAIINISASPYHAGKHDARVCLVQNLARKSGCAVLYANLVGGQDELVFDGGSMIASKSGQIVAQAPLFKESLIFADLPASGVDKAVTPKMPLEEEVYQALVLGTRDYIQKNGFSKVLVGLSGGIDSALVASVACDALGADRVVGVTMPSRYTSGETLSDAERLASNMGFTCHKIGIEPIFKAYLETLQPFFKELPVNITEENLQARVRGNLLMAFSNKWGYLVLTTGNKSEMATGYCTLYGDMAGGFAVIKDVPKSLVFRLAKHRNRQSKSEWIPDSTIKRAPTAELKLNQKDQDTLPPYTVLDSILQAYVEHNKDISAIVSKQNDKKTVQRVIGMVNKSEYKRRQAPPGIKITPKAFGRDWRMPITNQFKPL